MQNARVRDYAAMSGMIFGDIPPLNATLTSVAALQEAINATVRKPLPSGKQPWSVRQLDAGVAPKPVRSRKSRFRAQPCSLQCVLPNPSNQDNRQSGKNPEDIACPATAR
ncbi:hypothetical protein J2W39_005926 [Variovorax paradoxus]|uniref:Uncharacterized protein n=1 Tax=Variovorax paradoxus TaxID=34073 RepID=A0AAW8ENC2_VARPD|nr:hypothetical protein [Variovorax paradoxus]MDP9974656.1 hypothetical protein [Variovorax paradoxus]